MPLQIRQKYESMLNGDEEHDRHLKLQLLNFDEAMIHPTKEDLEHATALQKTASAVCKMAEAFFLTKSSNLSGKCVSVSAPFSVINTVSSIRTPPHPGYRFPVPS